MEHTSTITIEADSAPGVSLRLHKPTKTRKAVFVRLAADAMERVQRLIAEARALQAKPEAECDTARLVAVVQLLGAEVETVNAARVFCFLESTPGLLIDGVAPTVQAFIADAPDKLRQECVTRIQEMLATADEPQNPATSELTMQDPSWTVQ
jgi:hypothetical protein